MSRIITILLVVLSLTCFLQKSKYSINKNVDLVLKEESVKVDTSNIHVYKLQVENNSDSRQIFWLSEINKTGLNNEQLIRNHFFKTKGDFNLFQLATDNISKDSKLPLNSISFLTKVINPQSIFQYNINANNQKSDEIKNSLERLITNQIVIIPETETKKFFEIETIDKILFKGNSSMIDWELLESKIID